MEQKVFVKGNKYISKNEKDKIIVLCTKTTCELSNNHFKGVIIEIITPDNSVRNVGTYNNFMCSSFDKYIEKEKEKLCLNCNHPTNNICHSCGYDQGY